MEAADSMLHFFFMLFITNFLPDFFNYLSQISIQLRIILLILVISKFLIVATKSLL